VPSPLVRPTVSSSSGSRSEDDLTYFYKEVLRSVKEFAKRSADHDALADDLEEKHGLPELEDEVIELSEMAADGMDEDASRQIDEVEQKIREIRDDVWEKCRDARHMREIARKLLAARCADIVKPDHSTKLIIPDSDRILGRNKRKPQNNRKAIHARLGGKGGRFRGNLMGKRTDFTARTVIAPLPPLYQSWEVGVPEYICKIMTYPDRVTSLNIDILREAVRIGSGNMNGATFVVKQDPALGRSTTISLILMSQRERDEFANSQLAVGDVVERHLRKGDWVMMNRQPTLHRGSWMSFQVVPITDFTFQFHPCAMQPFNADCDGDEMNMHVVRSAKAMAEVMSLMASSLNIRGVGGNAPRCGLIQSDNFAAFWLTKTD